MHMFIYLCTYLRYFFSGMGSKKYVYDAISSCFSDSTSVHIFLFS